MVIMKTINSLTTFPQALRDKDKELPESSRMGKAIFHTVLLYSQASTSSCFTSKCLDTHPAKNHANQRLREYCSVTCPVCQPSSYTMKAFLSTQQTKSLLFQPCTVTENSTWQIFWSRDHLHS